MELAVRTAMLKLGGRLLEGLLDLDSGHRGPVERYFVSMRLLPDEWRAAHRRAGAA